MRDLKQLAQDTLAIAQSGKLPITHGAVDFLAKQTYAQENSQVYTSDELHAVFERFANLLPRPKNNPTQVDVWACTTQEAVYRLRDERAVLFNFASAKNVGGGFLGGAKAQEEDLC